MFEETGLNSWNGIRVRRGENYGTVVQDLNGFRRQLKIKMDDGTTEYIVMNNMGKDSPEVHNWEWYYVTPTYETWYRF